MPLTMLPHWSEAAHLHHAVMAPRELDEVVGLENHVVEFQEGQRLFALEPELDAIEGQHPVDGEVRAVIPEQGNVVELVQPFGVVGHDGAGGAAVETQIFLERAANAQLVLLDLFVGEDPAAFILAAGIADLGGAAAKQHDGTMPGLLQQAQHHDLNQRAHMEARGGAIETDVRDHGLLVGGGIQPRAVRALMDVAPLVDRIHEI